MITGIAVCPNPPLLLPGATGAPVAEVEELRTACLAAISVLLGTGPASIVLIGASQEQDEPDGVLSAQVGHSLLAQAGASAVDVTDQIVPPDLPPEECVLLGEGLAADERRIGLLVMADGSARRTEKAPGHFDDRAQPFDAIIEAALRSGHPAAFADLDPQLATDLLVSGRPAWQIMAAAVSAGPYVAPWTVRSEYFAAPFGVFYAVVNWLPPNPASAG